MRRRTSLNALIPWVLAALVPSLTLAAEPSPSTQRRFEVRDSIEVAQFSEAGRLSPDGKWVIAVTQRGVLPQGVTEATVWLFDANAVRQAIRGTRPSVAVAPVVLARLSAAINGDAGQGFGKIVTRLTWESGNKSLLLLGRDGRENRQLFRVGIGDRQLTALTPPTQDVVDYSAAGDTIAYFAGPDVASEKFWWSNDPAAPDIVVGTGQPLSELLYPGYRLNNRFMPAEFAIWRIRGAAPEPVMGRVTGQPMRLLGSYYAGAMALSPDAKHLVVIAHAERVPSTWQRYEVPGGLDGEPFQTDPEAADAEVPLARRKNDYTRASQYQLIDFEAGTYHPLIAAPVADFLRGGDDTFQAAWSRDGHQVVVTGTFPPIDDSLGKDAPIKHCGAAVVSVENGRFNCLIDRREPKTAAVSAVRWSSAGDRLQAQLADDSAIEYERSGTRWHSTARQRSASPPLEFTIQQSLDEPPVLVATDARSGRALPILDPNPQLKNIALGNVSVYAWKTPRGQDVYAGLAKPPDFSPGHRYPLVIQTHGFPRDQFFNTGLVSNTAAAGRALAARGMLVLQVREPRNDSNGTWREATQRGTEVYLAAIDQLAREGLVDPTKVGIAGYSRQGAFVTKALTEAPERFAAAVVANTAPGSPFAYYTFLDERTQKVMRDFAEFQAGALPYGEGLQKWLERAAGFRTDRIRAPVLVAAGDPVHLIALWSLYAPLRDQGTPVELQYIRSGHHNFVKPLQVLAHQEMLVDWFDFWLNAHEETDPAKAEQYARWRAMKNSSNATGHPTADKPSAQ